MKLYNDIEQAIRNHALQLSVPKETTQDDVYQCIRSIMRESPDIFWFSHQWKYTEKDWTIRFHYTMDREKSFKAKAQIEDVVQNDFHINEVFHLSTAERVMYVYKWLALYCKYNIYSAYNQTIYSVFVCRNSVCTGYAKAAQYLFKALGIESRLVFGTMRNAEKGSRHCWLVVKIDGLWYHIDPTFTVPEINDLLVKAGVDSVFGADGLVYNLFCCDTKTIKQSRTIEDEEELPDCNSNIDYKSLQNLTIKIHRNEGTERMGVRGCLLSDSGYSASVYLWHSNDQVQKIAKVYRNDIPNSRIMRHESHIMRELSTSPYTIRLLGITDDENGIILEQATPLTDLLCSPGYMLSAKDFCRLLLNIISALKECLNHNIWYGDIHLNNIYQTHKGEYVLGDFGCCKWIGKKNPLFTGGFSEWFSAPEIVRYGVGYESSLTYGVGMLAYFILNNLFPPLWDEYGLSSAEKRCDGCDLNPPVRLKSLSDSFSGQLLSVVMKSLSYDPNNRFHHLDDLRDSVMGCQNFLKDDYILIDTNYWVSNGAVDNFATTMATNVSCVTSSDSSFHLSLSKESIDNLAVTKQVLGQWDDNQDLVWNQFQQEETERRNREKQLVEKTEKIERISYFEAKSEPKGCMRPSPESGFLVSSHHTSNISIWQRIFAKRKRKSNVDEVFSSVFAPAEVKPKYHLQVQVYLHLFEETEKVKALAQESDKDAERRDYIPLQCKLKKGDKVDVQLNIYGESLLMSDKKSVVWQGSFTKCSFDYFVPRDIDEEELSCVVLLTVNGVPVGEMRFIIDVVDYKSDRLHPEIIAHKYNKVFISYSHQDESKVKFLHEGLELGAVPHFFDRKYLKAGDVFPQVIQDYINSADLFILCWSENASKSEYVQKERLQALERAFPQVKPEQEAKLRIYPMSIEPRAELPSDMKENYHFGEI